MSRKIPSKVSSRALLAVIAAGAVAISTGAVAGFVPLRAAEGLASLIMPGTGHIPDTSFLFPLIGVMAAIGSTQFLRRRKMASVAD